MNLRKEIFVIFSLFLIFGIFGDAFAGSPNCGLAKQLFDRSLTADMEEVKESLLQEAIKNCPTYAPAYNNLADLKESTGDYEKAAQLYQKAIDADPEMANAYAGLGDAYQAQGRMRQAACAYRLFIDLVLKQKEDGDPNQVAQHIPHYQQQWEATQSEALSAAPASTAEIEACLSMANAATSKRAGRGIRVTPVKARKDIQVHFEFGKHRLTPNAKKQLIYVAEALNSEKMQHRRIVIDVRN